MRVSEEVVNRLVANGIDTVFGIPGLQTLPLNETISEREDIRYIMSRHETAVSHQAWGYAETTGRPAATFVVPGPGDMNAMNGLKNALNDCTPLIHISMETEPEIRGGDGIHETPPDTYDNVVKENVLVENPENTIADLEHVISVAMTPPRGPVRLGIPKNFLDMSCEWAEAGPFTRESITDVPASAVEEATDLLSNATAPIIVAGGGIRAAGASEELRAIAEALGAPVVTTYKGKGVFPEDHDLSAGVLCGGTSPELAACIADSDVALGVGTDFDAVATQTWSINLPEKLIHVTIDEDDIGTGYSPTVGIVADAKRTLAEFLNRLPDDHTPANGTERASAVRASDQERIEPLLSRTDPPFTSPSLLEVAREVLPRETIVTVDAGGYRLWTLISFEAYGPHSYVNPGSWASMGTGVPSAIGAQVANPDRSVVALTGDGGLMMCLHELHTAVAEELPITVIVFNNNDYAVISKNAEATFGFDEGEYEWDTVPINFAGVAENLGMAAYTPQTLDEFRNAVGQAVKNNRPALIEIITDPREPQANLWMSDG
jgi:acetolactate synthase-1/2/3 large subunit